MEGRWVGPAPAQSGGVPAQGGGLAIPVANPGTNGSNMRYYVGNLQRVDPNTLTDGVYFYNNDGLSYDRPDRAVPGLPAANDSSAWNVFTPPSSSPVSSALPGPSAVPGFVGSPPGLFPPPRANPVPIPPGIFSGAQAGTTPPWGYEGPAPSAQDWRRMPGFYESDTRDPFESAAGAGPSSGIHFEGAPSLAMLQRILKNITKLKSPPRNAL